MYTALSVDGRQYVPLDGIAVLGREESRRCVPLSCGLTSVRSDDASLSLVSKTKRKQVQPFFASVLAQQAEEEEQEEPLEGRENNKQPLKSHRCLGDGKSPKQPLQAEHEHDRNYADESFDGSDKFFLLFQVFEFSNAVSYEHSDD